jgi:hypothetical protein
MKAYLGIFIVMSIMKVPSYTMAWSASRYFSIPGIADIMTKGRFEKLSKYFHVNSGPNPPRGQNGHDKLHKIRPVLNAVNQKCMENYSPHRDQSIDEAMVAYKGRLSFRQYLPAKPTKFGIKVWMRADSKSGYCHEIQVYQGRDARGVPEAGLGSRVVSDLTLSLRGNNHHIYVDNYFSSPKLFEDLLEHQVYACGTVRTNRKGLPAGIKYAGSLQKQGDQKVWQKGGLNAAIWRDKKAVAFLFTNCGPDQTTTVARKQRDGSVNEVECPLACGNYTRNMGGVDRHDQFRAQYTVARKSKKWWRYLFWFLLDVCLVNSFLCMRESVNHRLWTRRGRERKRNQLEFRMALADQLIGQFRGARKRKLPSVIDELGQGHWPKKFEKRGKCRLCSEENRRHEVYLGCTVCQVHLCVDNDCFVRYHQRLARRVGGADA